MEIHFDGKDLMSSIPLQKMNVIKLTPAKIREIVTAGHLASGPGFNKRLMPSTNELDIMLRMCRFAVARGQMIDFGHWPNEFIKETAGRAGPLYIEKALAHPFNTPWIFLHSWSDPKLDEYYQYNREDSTSTAAYLVNPFPDDKNGAAIGCDCEVVELVGMTVEGVPMLTVGDRGIFTPSPGDKTYNCAMFPVMDRFIMPDGTSPFKDLLEKHVQYHGAYKMAAVGNILDPMVDALLLLNTRGVPQETVTASSKLNKARIKSGKLPIPPYRRVITVDYVTAIMHRIQRTAHEPGDGSRKSPVAHVRIGHWRHYKTGERSFIRDTMVMATPEMKEQFIATRSHYNAKD